MSLAQPVVQTALLIGEPGHFHVPEQSAHLLTVHASGTMGQSIASEGPLRRRELRRGDIDVIPAGAPLRLSDEAPSQVLALLLDPAWAEAAFDDLGLGGPKLRPQFSLRDSRLADLAWRMHRRRQAGLKGLYDDCLGAEVLRGLHRAQQPDAAAEPRRTRSLRGAGLRRVLDYIESHIDEPITIQELALEAGLGPTAFKEAFRAAFGAPAHRYVVRRRAERARLMLLEGELPQSQVALEAGFTHQTHMARWMRRLFGVLPSELARRDG